MKDFEKIITDKFNFVPFSNCYKYSREGKVFNIDDENFKGIYWYYETSDYIIDITDIYVKRDVVINENFKISNVELISNYIITGEGEWFKPFQNLNSNSVLILDSNNIKPHYLLFGNRPYLSVSIKFKEKMFNDLDIKLKKENIYNMFFETKEKITQKIFKISDEIIKTKLTEDEARQFFEKKAREWLQIILKSYNEKREDLMSKEDERAIFNVGRYIDENYSKNITQNLLEDIALMSGTKLKVKFREKYGMSITEYIQRRRINVAESLILNSKLSISDIAKKVGYTSCSRFSLLFKRYKGIKPTEVKNLKGKTGCLGCPIYNKCEVK